MVKSASEPSNASESQLRVTAAELARNMAYWQEQALERPVAITYHGRERLVLAPAAMLRGAPAANGNQLDELSTRYEKLREQLTIGFFACDAHGRCTDVNRVTEVYFDRSRSTLIGGTFLETFGRRPPHLLEDAMRAALDDREEISIEVDSALYPGRRLSMKFFPFAGGVAGFFRDITEETRLAHRVARKESLLTAVEANGSVAIVHVDTYGRIAKCNGVIRGWTAFSEADLMARPFADIVVRADRRAFTERLIATMETRAPSTLEISCTTKDLRTVALHVGLAPHLEGHGVLGATVVATRRDDSAGQSGALS